MANLIDKLVIFNWSYLTFFNVMYKLYQSNNSKTPFMIHLINENTPLFTNIATQYRICSKNKTYKVKLKLLFASFNVKRTSHKNFNGLITIIKWVSATTSMGFFLLWGKIPTIDKQ